MRRGKLAILQGKSDIGAIFNYVPSKKESLWSINNARLWTLLAYKQVKPYQPIYIEKNTRSI